MRTPLPQTEETKLPADCYHLPDGWQNVRLGAVAAVSSGGTPSRTVQRYWGGMVPWLTTSAINFNVITKPSEMITKEGLQRSSAKVFLQGTILMAMYGQGATRGRVAILGFEAAINQACAAIQPRQNVNHEYLFYSLMALYDEIREIGHGGNQKNLNSQLIRSIPLALPPLPEQSRIVEILDAADAAIRATESLLEAKIRYKRALAEHILTGKIRFPEFNGQAWHHVEIGDLLTEVERPVVWDEEKFYDLISIRRRSEGLFFRGAIQGKAIKTKTLKTVTTDDFLISRMQVVHGAWGRVSADFDGFYVSDSYITLVPKPEVEVDVCFFDYLSQTPYLYRFAHVSSHGVHIEKMTFNLDLFLRNKIVIPPTKTEQQKIANVLGLIDQEISLLRRELETLKQQKQGLMQKLLTGQVRVREFAL